MENIFKEIQKERYRQNAKWGIQNRNPVEWIAILTEEVGEASKEAVDLHFDSKSEFQIDHRIKDLREELIQVAAVAVQIIENIDRNRLGYNDYS